MAERDDPRDELQFAEPHEKEVEVGRFAGAVRSMRKSGTSVTKAGKTALSFESAANGSGGDDSAKRAAEEAAEKRRAVVEAFNREYALVLLGSSIMVMHEQRDPDTGQLALEYLTVDAFKEWTRADKLWLGGKAIKHSTIWLDSPDRRRYRGIMFEPRSGAPEGFYNLWKGLAIEPDARGELGCPLLLDHIFDIICGSSASDFSWVIGWLASIVQEPANKSGTALVLKGPQGAGKSLLGTVMRRILGDHYYIVSDPRMVTGRFNSHLQRLLLLQVDEATWGGDHESTGKLKDLITGDTHVIELKGKEPIVTRNYLRALITSNLDWVVPAGFGERRFTVLEVSGDRSGDRPYFDALFAEIEAGGAACFLHVLQSFSLRSVDLRTPLRTRAGDEQQARSITTEYAWWEGILTSGALPGDVDGDGRAPNRSLHDDYIEYCIQHNERQRMNDTALGIFLAKVARPFTRGRRSFMPSGPREPFRAFPPLAICRAQYAELSKRSGDWDDDEEEWSPARSSA